MKNLIHKKYFVFLLFLVFVFSGCSTSPSEQTRGETSPISINLQFPESNKLGKVNAVKTLTVDPSAVSSLTLIVTDNTGKELTTKTISVTSGQLVSITFDVPLGLELTISAIISNAQGTQIFKGKSIPLNFERGQAKSVTITMEIFNSLLGTWKGVRANGDVDLVLIFISDSEYFMAEDFTDGDPNCNSGMEHGFYSWDLGTGVLNITGNLTDTTGNCGLNATPNEPFNFRVNGDVLSLTAADGQFVPLSRVKSTSNPLVGSWFIGTEGATQSTVITFVDDSNYMVSSDISPNAGTGELDFPGMERGTYTLNPTTELLSVNVITNTNGELFFSDPAERFNLAVFGNTMTMRITDNDATGFNETIPFRKIPFQETPVFVSATVPGTYDLQFSDEPGANSVYTFNANGTGDADFAGEPPNDPFNWSVDAQGVLVVKFLTFPLALPDRYILVAGTSDAGTMKIEVDDSPADGVYELFPTVTFTKRATSAVSSLKFSTATVPGTYQISIRGGDGLTNVFTFNADKTGVAEFSNFSGVVIESFTWSVDAQGVLIVNLTNVLPQALPDLYTLVSGTTIDGVVDAKVDDDEDGLYEAFETSTFTQIIPAQSFKTTLKKVDKSTQDVVLTRGAFFDVGTLPGSYRLLIPDTAQDLIVVLNSTGNTGTIKFPEDLTPQSIVWKVTADGVLRFIETDGFNDKWFWTITGIANNTQNALVSVITPAGQIDASDVNILGDFTPLQ